MIFLFKSTPSHSSVCQMHSLLHFDELLAWSEENNFLATKKQTIFLFLNHFPCCSHKHFFLSSDNVARSCRHCHGTKRFFKASIILSYNELFTLLFTNVRFHYPPRAEPTASLGWQLQVGCRLSDSASIVGFIRMTHLRMVGPFTSPVQIFTWTLTWNLMSLIFDDLNCSIECVCAFTNATVHTRSIYNYWLSIDLIFFF